MPIKNCSHWIFDMDGTLTMPIHDFDHIRTQLGFQGGVPILETIEAMPELQAAAIKRELHDIEMQIAHDAVAQPGASALLAQLVDRDCTVGILTRNDEDIALATLQACGLDTFFEPLAVIGRETCAPKPAPDGVLHLLALWGAAPLNSIMVGDYLYDIEAGRRAGVHTLHFDHTGVYAWPDLADYKVDEIAAISALLLE